MSVRTRSRRAVAGAVLAVVSTTSPFAFTGVSVAATVCTQDWRPASIPAYLEPDGTLTDPLVLLPPAPTPQHRAAHVFCGAHYVNTVWRAPTDGPSEATVAAYNVVTGARYPSVRPAVNPTTGITGLPSWFWATPDDSPVRMLPGNGPGVDIELRIDTVRWRFGDATTTGRGLGLPYPTPSPVSHTFERKGTVTVEVRVALVGHLRGEELDAEVPGGHRVLLRHPVVEVRSLLHAS